MPSWGISILVPADVMLAVQKKVSNTNNRGIDILIVVLLFFLIIHALIHSLWQQTEGAPLQNFTFLLLVKPMVSVVSNQEMFLAGSSVNSLSRIIESRRDNNWRES